MRSPGPSAGRDAAEGRISRARPPAGRGSRRAAPQRPADEQAQLLDHITRLGPPDRLRAGGAPLARAARAAEVAGLATGPAFPMPLTQETLADALGLSVVHVNRILQQLRREKLVELSAGRAVLLQPDLLAGIADFRSAEG